MSQSYLERGVSPTKDEVKAAVKHQDQGIFPGAFCKVLPDLAGDPAWCTAVHADGAGTKSSAAYLMARETGDRKWYRGIAQDSLVMNTDDLACIGATDHFLLSNTIGRNAHRVDGASIAAVIEGYDAVVRQLSDHGIEVVMTGGETADVGDLVGTLIVDSTVTVRLRRERVRQAAQIRPGLSIVGLSSTGRTSYETTENSGVSSNGLTAVRHLMLCHDYYSRYPETVSSTMPEAKAYCGRYRLEDPLPGSVLTVGEAILSPTRTYLPVLKPMLERFDDQIVALLHCTGGGQVKCRDFGKGVHYIKDNLFPVPPLFGAVFEQGQIEARELYQVFNMGHRMEVYCEPAAAEAVIQLAATFNLDARIIGRTAASGGINRVTVETELGRFEY